MPIISRPFQIKVNPVQLIVIINNISHFRSKTFPLLGIGNGILPIGSSGNTQAYLKSTIIRISRTHNIQILFIRKIIVSGVIRFIIFPITACIKCIIGTYVFSESRHICTVISKWINSVTAIARIPNHSLVKLAYEIFSNGCLHICQIGKRKGPGFYCFRIRIRITTQLFLVTGKNKSSFQWCSIISWESKMNPFTHHKFLGSFISIFISIYSKDHLCIFFFTQPKRDSRIFIFFFFEEESILHPTVNIKPGKKWISTRWVHGGSTHIHFPCTIQCQHSSITSFVWFYVRSSAYQFAFIKR